MGNIDLVQDGPQLIFADSGDQRRLHCRHAVLGYVNRVAQGVEFQWRLATPSLLHNRFGIDNAQVGVGQGRMPAGRCAFQADCGRWWQSDLGKVGGHIGGKPSCDC